MVSSAENVKVRINNPTKRLYMYSQGDRVTLAGYEKEMTIVKIRDDGYYDLANDKGRIIVTASSGHEVK